MQDTVRRECEERFDLTEALNSAKEELLALKKPRGLTVTNAGFNITVVMYLNHKLGL